MIELNGVSCRFGGVRAVDALDLSVGPGEILGLIGPNGSGKSTTVNLVAGLVPAASGRILIGGRDVTGMPAHRRAAAGLARTFQHSRVFGPLTVRDNVLAGRLGRPDGAATVERALAWAGLARRADALAEDLAPAERRRLELARVLAAQPRAVLLDEPGAGLDTGDLRRLGEAVLGLRDTGAAILLVDHTLDLVFGVADRIAVLNAGRKIADGPTAVVRDAPMVRHAYLGEHA